MTEPPEDERWELLARELPFTQLGALRAQADGWRTGIVGVATILISVVIVKGRSDVVALEAWARVTIAVLVLLAFGALAVSLLLTLRVAQGPAGKEIWNTGENLRKWTAEQTFRGGRRLRVAAYLASGALLLLVVAMSVGWLAPAAAQDASTVVVRTIEGSVCGRFDSLANGKVVLQVSGQAWTAPSSAILEIRPVKGC
ncbi:hypothetical protein OG439_27340 [Amycolatopsis sp. NBC_01307]|uniref:hypothetical protein n=1 Tax=Amycolatopsis sp. NBC_01307 TaxID=2903561 RepID=UPI002E13AF63|nr:hypothetical protein OG439_27340 [Amycolatopsis sp. NBC_01307]